MVQPAASTSTCACIIDPIVNSAPYQLISGPCSAIGSLAQRIINFVTSIFTAIANFVKSCFCGAPAATPPAAAAATGTPAPARPSPLTAPAPVAPPGVNIIEQGKIFLNRLFEGFAVNFNNNNLLALMRNEQAGNAFLASLLVYALVMVPNSLRDLEIPFMVNRGVGSTSLTFIASVDRLRASFARLDPVHATENSDSDDDVEQEGAVAEAVRVHFFDRHLTTHVPQAADPHRSSEVLVDDDVFDANPDNTGSPSNIFYAQLKTLAGKFVMTGMNPTFVAAANAFRGDYIRNHQTV